MNNLQYYRDRKKKLKLTNDAIAEISGIPKRTVEDFFRGASQNPRIDTVQAIERALGISHEPEWTDEEKALGVGNHPTYLSEEEWEWIELRNEILSVKSPEYLEAIINLIKTAIKN